MIDDLHGPVGRTEQTAKQMYLRYLHLRRKEKNGTNGMERQDKTRL